MSKLSEASERQIDSKALNLFIQEFANESDRAAVILGAAKIDLLLGQILERFMSPSPTGKDELLDGDAPLGTFSAKIHLVYRLGLVDATFAKSLHLSRKIRNAFAHEISGCDLNSGAHSDRVKELILPLKHLPFFVTFRRAFFKEPDSTSSEFRATLGLIVGRLEHLLLHVEPIRLNSAFPMINPAWTDFMGSDLDAAKKEDSKPSA